MNIPDLKPDRVYVVQVRSTNKFNVGEWSEDFEFETSGKGRQALSWLSLCLEKVSYFQGGRSEWF